MEEFEDTPMQKIYYASWVINSLGWPTLHLLLCATIIACALVTLLSSRGRGPARPVAILFLIPTPLFLGCLISLGATIHWLMNEAMGQATASNTAEVISRSLLAIMVSATCTLPILVFGLVALFKPESQAITTIPVKDPTHG